MKRNILIASFFLTTLSQVSFCQTAYFSVSVNKDSAIKISPYIYGTNQLLTGGENWKAMRIGGNRMTGYNWENNASNAGSDYLQESDNYLPYVFGVPSDSQDVPAIVTEAFYRQAAQFSAYPLVTLQMAGFVAKDKAGIVDSSQRAPSSRWAYVDFNKSSPLSLIPDTSDDTVYMDEYLNFLVNKYGAANSQTGIKGYELDNEPDLWSSTHPLLHPAQPTCTEIVQRSIALAETIKRIDSTAEVFGPVSYGFNGYYHFQGAPDWTSVSTGKTYSWFIDYYLDQMKKASDAYGKRLLDVLDLHWYPEAQGDHRITDTNASTTNDIKARVQAPRTLWDKSYLEKSWIAQYYPQFLPLLPRLIQSINKYYPGTKLAITEINYGGEKDISGAIAMADVIGTFSKYGVYLDTFWQLNNSSPYISAAYRIYTNYDGDNSSFGSYYLPSTSSDIADCSIYSSVDDGTNEIHLIVINKNYNEAINGTFAISSPQPIGSGRVWELDSLSPQIHELDTLTTISNNSFTYSLPPASVLHFVLSTTGTINSVISRTVPTQYNLAAYPNPFNPTCKIDFSVDGNSNAELDIYSVQGVLVKSFGGLLRSGTVVWDGTNMNNAHVASGVYFAILKSPSKLFATQKLLLLK